MRHIGVSDRQPWVAELPAGSDQIVVERIHHGQLEPQGGRQMNRILRLDAMRLD